MATKMTIEEALNKVRQMSLPKETMEILQALAPELAESEDERIRKWLCDYFSSIDNAWIHKDITCIDILKWLEKQKDSASNNFDDVWDEEDCEEIIAEGQKLTPRFKELLKEVCHAWYDRGTKLEKQKEASKAIEAVDILNCCISSIEEAKENRYAYKETDGDTSYDREIAWLKSIRPSWKPSEGQMKALNALNCYGGLSYVGQQNQLVSLYQDLKKLM